MRENRKCVSPILADFSLQFHIQPRPVFDSNSGEWRQLCIFTLPEIDDNFINFLGIPTRSACTWKINFIHACVTLTFTDWAQGILNSFMLLRPFDTGLVQSFPIGRFIFSPLGDPRTHADACNEFIQLVSTSFSLHHAFCFLSTKSRDRGFPAGHR